MKLHEGTLYQISKRVNDGHWMLYDNVRTTREDAQRVMDAGLAHHLDCCPKDRVEFSITKVY